MTEDDLVVFRKKCFGFDSAYQHRVIIEKIDKAKPGRIVLVLVPPDHGKSTTINDYICMKLAKDRNHRFLYISESQGLARKMLGRVKRRMTDPSVAPHYYNAYGPFYVPGQEKQAKPWSADYISLADANLDSADYNLEAMGWSSQIYGARADTVILDDYQTLRTANMTEQLLEKFQLDIVTRPDEDTGRIIIIGTRIANDDFYIRLIEEGIVLPEDVVILPAIMADGSPLWPERWPLEKLEERRRKVQDKIWFRSYMMKPQADGTATFKAEITELCKNIAYRIGQPALEEEQIWATVDPAVDGGTALHTYGIASHHMRLIQFEKRWGLGTMEAILEFLETESFAPFRPQRVIVEAAVFQKVLARDERMQKLRDLYGFEIVEHQTGNNKNDFSFGVARMASSFVTQEIVIPWGDYNEGADRKKIIRFLDEFHNWRPNISGNKLEMDHVMAMWFAWLRWQQFRAAARHGTMDTVRTAGTPWKPTGLNRITTYV